MLYYVHTCIAALFFHIKVVCYNPVSTHSMNIINQTNYYASSKSIAL